MARLVYGLRPVEELLRARRPVTAIFHADGPLGPAMAALLSAAQAARIPVEARTRDELDALAAGATHNGVIAIVGEYRYAELSEILAAASDANQAPLVMVLDGITDPHNLGALVRSAHVLGAHGVVVAKDRAVGVTPAAVKASAGATEHTRIARVTNIARTLDELKERGIWIVGAAVEQGEDPSAIDFTTPTAIVLGSEGKGLRPLVLKTCDLRARIPMVGRVASLNVSAAGAILLYEALRQRRAK